MAGPWLIGLLANQVWSFANASSTSRPNVNAGFYQPFVSYVARHGVTYTVESEASTNSEAPGGVGKWSVPIYGLISRLTKLGPFPISVPAGAGVYATAPTGGPDWTLRTNFVLLLPRGEASKAHPTEAGEK